MKSKNIKAKKVTVWERKGPRVDATQTKVSVTFRMDMDVLNWARLEAERMGVGYQTFIGMVLKERMNAREVFDLTMPLPKSAKDEVIAIVREEMAKLG